MTPTSKTTGGELRTRMASEGIRRSADATCTCHRGQGRIRAWAQRAARGMLSAAAALALLVTAGQDAQAQTVVSLVSNTGESQLPSGSALIQATSFETGSQSVGYVVTEVRVSRAVSRSTRTTVVTIREDDSNEPGTLVATLIIDPSSVSTGVRDLIFTAPDGTTLEADTTYWVVVNEGLGFQSGEIYGLTQ